MDTSKYVQVGETIFGAHWSPGCARLHSPVGFIRNCISDTPELTHNVEVLCATHFLNPLPECRRHRCPQTDHKAFSRTVLNETRDECGARVAKSRGFLTDQGLECSTICILANGWQLWTNLYWKLWALHLTRRCLNSFFFQGVGKNPSSPITDMMQVRLMG